MNLAKTYEIRALEELNLDDLEQLIIGHSSNFKYKVFYEENKNSISFKLNLIQLEKKYTKKYAHVNKDVLNQYRTFLSAGYSFGAYQNKLLVGIIIAMTEDWNSSINVWEFHVKEAFQNNKIGKKMMECVSSKARQNGYRAIVCETQNTNVTAINIYRKLGFRIEGLDISYYTNNDYPNGDIAVFLKQRL